MDLPKLLLSVFLLVAVAVTRADVGSANDSTKGVAFTDVFELKVTQTVHETSMREPSLSHIVYKVALISGVLPGKGHITQVDIHPDTHTLQYDSKSLHDVPSSEELFGTQYLECGKNVRISSHPPSHIQELNAHERDTHFLPVRRYAFPRFLVPLPLDAQYIASRECLSGKVERYLVRWLRRGSQLREGNVDGLFDATDLMSSDSSCIRKTSVTQSEATPSSDDKNNLPVFPSGSPFASFIVLEARDEDDSVSFLEQDKLEKCSLHFPSLSYHMDASSSWPVRAVEVESETLSQAPVYTLQRHHTVSAGQDASGAGGETVECESGNNGDVAVSRSVISLSSKALPNGLSPESLLRVVETSQQDTDYTFGDYGLDDDMEAYLEERAGFPPPPPVFAMLSAVTGLLLKPMMMGAGAIIEPQMTNEMGRLLQGAVDTGIVEEVITVVPPPVARNVSNLGVDAITYYVTDRVATLLTTSLGEQLTADVSNAVVPGVSTAIEKVLREDIPKTLESDIPTTLQRMIPDKLTRQLTHSITHATVATLSHTLQNLKVINYFCQACTEKALWCDYCRMSNKNYYSSYYSTYYSDHYATYYGAYYGKALTMLIEDKLGAQS